MADQVDRFKILIASPSDTEDLRFAIRDAIARWNITARRGTRMLQPLGWELGPPPLYGSPAQAVVNEAIVDEADFGIAVFRARLGSETQKAPSGTVEEIERLADAGRPVLVYRVRRVPVDPTDQAALVELGRLATFLTALMPKALVREFDDASELQSHLTSDLQYVVDQLSHPAPAVEVPTEPEAADPDPAVVVHPSSDRHILDLEVRNVGEADLVDLTVAVDTGRLRSLRAPIVVGGASRRLVPPGSAAHLQLVHLPGMATRSEVVVSWRTRDAGSERRSRVMEVAVDLP